MTHRYVSRVGFAEGQVKKLPTLNGALKHPEINLGFRCHRRIVVPGLRRQSGAALGQSPRVVVWMRRWEAVLVFVD